MPDIEITRETWYKVVDKVREIKGPKTPVWKCLYGYYNVCILSVVSDESVEAWRLYNAIGGHKNETYESYQNLPVRWREQVQVIDREVNRIEEFRRKAAEKKQKAQQRKVQPYKGRK